MASSAQLLEQIDRVEAALREVANAMFSLAGGCVNSDFTSVWHVEELWIRGYLDDLAHIYDPTFTSLMKACERWRQHASEDEPDGRALIASEAVGWITRHDDRREVAGVWRTAGVDPSPFCVQQRERLIGWQARLVHELAVLAWWAGRDDAPNYG